MIFNMIAMGANTGGGGLDSTNALVIVTVPAGATVSAVKDGIVKTPTMWISAADSTMEKAVFQIPPTQFDASTPWTITASDGTITANTPVLITTNKEYDITPAFNIEFVKNGVLTSRQWTIATNPSYPGAAVVQETGQVMFTTGDEHTATVFGSTESYDLTPYSTIRLVIVSGESYYNSNHAPCVAIGRNRPTGSGSSSSATNLDYLTMLNNSTGSIVATTYYLDVTARTGLYYVGISLAGSGYLSQENGKGFIRVTEFGIYK